MAVIGKDINAAAYWLKQGQCIGLPTETVYGLAANALDTEAVASVFRIKDRPDFDPLIVHAGSTAQAFRWLKEVPAQAQALAEAFWPGPMTLVLPKTEEIPYQVTSGLETVAVRVPNHPLALDLLNLIEFPLSAPSANPFGYVSPTKASHVNDQLGNKIPYILDGGECTVGVESTIIGWESGMPVILRLGAVLPEQVREICGAVEVRNFSSSNPAAPGMLENHYAPKVKLKWYRRNEKLEMRNEELGIRNERKRLGFLGYNEFIPGMDVNDQMLLSSSGNIFEAARNLYAYLREMDRRGFDEVYVMPVPDEGFGKALNDRLRRAVG